MMRTLLVAVVFLWAHCALGASFDCKKAASPIEKAICASQKLDALDESLGMYYAAAQEKVGAARSCLRTDQRAWVGERNRCRDDACLERAYLNRLAELDPLVPGAISIRYVELPAVKQLVSILPPAEDTVAAPPVKDLKPLVVTGGLQDKVGSGGDGLVVTSEGKDYVVTLLMFLDKPTEELQELLKRGNTGRFEVRGFSEQGASAAFAPSRCRFVYRLPPR